MTKNKSWLQQLPKAEQKRIKERLSEITLKFGFLLGDIRRSYKQPEQFVKCNLTKIIKGTPNKSDDITAIAVMRDMILEELNLGIVRSKPYRHQRLLQESASAWDTAISYDQTVLISNKDGSFTYEPTKESRDEYTRMIRPSPSNRIDTYTQKLAEISPLGPWLMRLLAYRMRYLSTEELHQDFTLTAGTLGAQRYRDQARLEKIVASYSIVKKEIEESGIWHLGLNYQIDLATGENGFDWRPNEMIPEDYMM